MGNPNGDFVEIHQEILMEKFLQQIMYKVQY